MYTSFSQHINLRFLKLLFAAFLFTSAFAAPMFVDELTGSSLTTAAKAGEHENGGGGG